MDSNWHARTADDVLRALGTTREGLPPAEAAARLQRHGPNALQQAERRSIASVFVRQFASPLVHILIAAAAIAFAVGERDDALVILLIVVANAAIGTLQEGRAERSMQALRRLAELHARVRRGSEETVVLARDLVPGDLVVLAAGDAVGADARVVEAVTLATAEAELTGESFPVAKQAAPRDAATLLADRDNMVYGGTHVAAGRGLCVVVATGAQSEIGRIARLTAEAADPPTPLEQQIAAFGRWLVRAAVALFLLVVAVGLLRGLPFYEILMVALSQMVSMVPEGLPVAMTIALAVGMQRMAQRRAIVRRLAAVETLGCTTVICSDKTGTLTKNEMTVVAAFLPGGRSIEVTGAGYEPAGVLREHGREVSAADPDLRALVEVAALCNDGRLLTPDAAEPRWRPVGDPTEVALLTFASKAGADLDTLRAAQPRQAEIQFDPEWKLMATQHGSGPNARVCIKGGPEAVRALCRGDSAGADAAVSAMAARALRVLAFAEIDGGTVDAARDFTQFAGAARFAGLVGMIDPPREEARLAVDECHRAGVRTVMVTGDHVATGLAVARQLGIAGEADLALDGALLERMTAQELRDRLDLVAVYARVHPAQKLRIVDAFQERGHVVAMTGDGVNDAPALARADVGVAMGISGTEVAKGSAEIVLADDHFATIVRAVEQGRLVHGNLRKVILFLFATSADEVVVLLLALVLGMPLPLEAVQILWINIVTEGVLTVNLVMEGPEGDEMRRPPVGRSEPLLTRGMVRRAVLMVAVASAATFGFYTLRLQSGAPLELVRSETFTVLAVCQWFNVLNCRSETRSALTRGILANAWLAGGLLLGNLLHFAVIYWEPLGRVFHTVPIPLADALLIGAVASTVLWAEELRKAFARRAARKSTRHGPS